MTLIVALLLAALAFGFVGYPLLRPRRDEVPPTKSEPDEALEDLLAKRESTYAAIQEIEFDHEVGSLSDEDYEDLEERYKERAVVILKELDALRQGEDLEDAIERQVAALRRGRRPAPVTESAPRAEARLTCPQCDHDIAEGDRFCTQCGARLQANCPNCQTPLRRGDRFCAQCGTPLGGEPG